MIRYQADSKTSDANVENRCSIDLEYFKLNDLKRLAFGRKGSVQGGQTANFARGFGHELNFQRLARYCLFLFYTAVIAVGFTGCVQRRMIVRSQPEGALVMIDNQSVGRTPVPVPYTYAGTREIQLEKDGFKTVKVRERIRPKWYDKFPLSFFSNNFAMREIRDERVLDFQLEPRTQVQENQLLDRANELRTNVERGTLTTPVQ